jgi:hypothetical protein
MNTQYRIPTGDFVGGKWDGPYWSPFAQAIADHYPVQIPWFTSFSVDLAAASAGVPSRATTLIGPFLYDIMLFGAMITGTASQAPMIGVQVTHQATGIPWAVNNVLPFIPLGAFGGFNTGASPLFKWPDIFFWPRGTRLKFDFNLIDTVVGNPDPVIITLSGVKLALADTPQVVTLPNGSQIRPTDRLPMWMTMGVGTRSGQTFFLDVGNLRIQFLPPIECDVEIHDASTNLVSGAFQLTPNNTSELSVKLTFEGVQNQWTPFSAPITSVFGGFGGGVGGASQIYTSLPFTAPYHLPKGSRIQTEMLNTSILTTASNGYLTFRGVRRCEYTG